MFVFLLKISTLKWFFVCEQELREQLWVIIDKCKEENEQERATLKSNGWLEAHTSLLTNHHSMLIQVTSQT